MWLRREKGGQWKKVVVDVKVTSTDKMNDEFKKMINIANGPLMKPVKRKWRKP